MAIPNWFGKKCGNCGYKSASDLPKYTCEKCGIECCPECGGDRGIDDDGNIYRCKSCAMKMLPPNILQMMP